MTNNRTGIVLHHLGRVSLRAEAEPPDAQLLERFIAARDGSAFEAIVRRHGPMVLGVCRRVLRNEADAEDAFQATFLVLVRKAPSIRPRGMVGNWLYGVAFNTARKARAMGTQRLRKEREAGQGRSDEAADPESPELQAVLDQELQALPDHYRVPIVLCDLEGKSIKEAARQAGTPVGTIGTRLARGRKLLARRLTRHGFALSAAGVAAALPAPGPAAPLRPPLLDATLRAASLLAAGQPVSGAATANVALLTEGVLRAMLLTKLRSGGLLVVLGVALGVATMLKPGAAELPPDGGPPPAAPALALKVAAEPGEEPEKQLDKEFTLTMKLGYLLYLPKDYTRGDAAWPLLLFLHGFGEAGLDLDRVKRHGPPKLIEEGRDFPFIVLSPQAPHGEWSPQVLNALLDEVTAKYRVDPDRVYVTGLSNGGTAAWTLAAVRPDRFAAVVPICATPNLIFADRLKDMPVWAFHGADDWMVPASWSKAMVNALKAAGSDVAWLTVYPGVGHGGAWEEAYEDPELYDWLLKQKRPASRRFPAAGQCDLPGAAAVPPRASPR